MFRLFSGSEINDFSHPRYQSIAFLYADSAGSNESAVALDFVVKNTKKNLKYKKRQTSKKNCFFEPNELQPLGNFETVSFALGISLTRRTAVPGVSRPPLAYSTEVKTTAG